MNNIYKPTKANNINQLTDTLKQSQKKKPASETELLSHQANILNDLFENIALEYLTNPPAPDRYAESQQHWLALALKAQQLTTQAIKARASVDYMNHLTPPPPPPKSDEQYDES